MRISILRIAAVVVTTLLLNACASTDYSAFKESRPRSILVMPPINQSPDVNAPLTFLATSVYPLAESGYYVIPVSLSDQTFKQNGITIAEEAHSINHLRLREIFGADAALYITITRYGTKFLITSSSTEAEAEVKLVDLRNGVELWQSKVRAEANSGGAVSGGGLIGALVTISANAAAQAINVAKDKAYDVGRDANHRMLAAKGGKGTILYGPYSPEFQSD